tara:strand:+ start:10513 stop:11883 length:1371 start_codon:yes stop_codon:yes gene_type:complete
MCGIIGVSGTNHVGLDVYEGLHAVQHRGKDGGGLVSFSDGVFNGPFMRDGIIAEAFTEGEIRGLDGAIALGHVRYATQGGRNKLDAARDAQPLLFKHTRNGAIAVAHNGDIRTAPQLRTDYLAIGGFFQGTSDTEVILHNFAKATNDSLDSLLTQTLEPIQEGAYSLVMIVDGKLVGARDVNGFRPLVLGKKEGGYMLASETVALKRARASYIREVEPGEIIVVEDSGPRSIRPFGVRSEGKQKKCVFEYAYFARPDGLLFNTNVAAVRREFGEILARKFPNLSTDMVGAVPDSGNDATIGYCHASGKPFEIVFSRDHFAGRTFIDPDGEKRAAKVRAKLSPYEGLEGKVVTLVDDSLVRSTTSRELVKMLKEVGVQGVNMLIAFWPFAYHCKYGIDTADDGELASHSMNPEEIRKYIGADFLGFLDQAEVLSAMKKVGGLEGFCTACSDGEYPVS